MVVVLPTKEHDDWRNGSNYPQTRSWQNGGRSGRPYCRTVMRTLCSAVQMPTRQEDEQG
jgi:hypothetical protein